MKHPPVYSMEAVRKKHSDAFTLEVEHLSVAQGEILCLLGPTGAGKSTLLRLLSGLESPSSGRMTFQGHRTENGDVPLEALRRVAAVDQRPLLLAESVRYNVEYGLRVRGVRNASGRSDSILERLGLSRLAAQDSRTLSGGQLQLVALGRALVVEPAVLLLDEPTAHLDPANVALVEGVVQDRQRHTGMSVVWATHNLFQAKRVATRVGLLLNAALIEVAETSVFFERPSDERTAQFVQGKMVY